MSRESRPDASLLSPASDPFGLRQQWRFLLLVAVLAVLVTGAFTYPWLREWRSSVPGFSVADAVEQTWATWWADRAIFDLGQSPAQLTHIYYPSGAVHPKELASLWPKLVAWPFIHLARVDPFVVYNFHLFASYVLTWVFMAWLLLVLTGSRGAALLGGLIFTFSMTRTMHTLFGHFTLVLTYTYPLVVLAILQLWRQPGWRRGITTGLVLALAALVDLMPLAFFVGPVVCAMLLVLLMASPRRFLAKRFVGSLAVGVGVAILIAAVAYVPLLDAALSGDLSHYKTEGAQANSADLLAPIIPPANHLLARAWPALQALSEQVHLYGYSESIVYQGWITLLLAMVAVATSWERSAHVRFWFTGALFTFVLALGPFLWLRGQRVLLRGAWVPMPYAILGFVPFYSWSHTPARFAQTTAFAVAILAAFGAAWLLKRLPNLRTQAVAVLVLGCLILLDAVNYMPWPAYSTQAPSFLSELAADERAVAVLDLPIFNYSAYGQQLLFQMHHGHALVGGWRDRRPDEVAANTRLLASWAKPGGDVNALAAAGIGYVILHRDFMEPGEADEIATYLTAQVGLPTFSDAGATVFTLPNPLEIAPRPVTIIP